MKKGVFAVIFTAAVFFAIWWVTDRRLREGDATQVEIACAFPDAGTLLLSEAVTVKSRGTGRTRHRMSFIDVKTGQRIARVGFDEFSSRLIGCDDAVAWVVSDTGGLEAWGPKGTLVAGEQALLENTKKAGGAVPAAPLQTANAMVHESGGVLVRGNEARLWVAPSTTLAFVPAPSEMYRREGRNEISSGGSFKDYRLDGSPLATFSREGKPVKLPPPYEQGLINPMSLNEIVLDAPAGFGVLVTVASGLDAKSTHDLLRFDLDGDTANVAWKRPLGQYATFAGERVGGRVVLLLGGNDGPRFQLVALEEKTGEQQWAYTP